MKLPSLGIGVYLNVSQVQMELSVQQAAEIGMRYIFTSLHLPEQSSVNLRRRLSKLAELTRGYGLQLIADIGPATLSYLQCANLLAVRDLELDFARIDYGFSVQEIAEYSCYSPILLNASTLDELYLEKLRQENTQFEHIAACHNFYPKPYSGLSRDYVLKQNKLCHQYGLQTMAFIAGDAEKREPIQSGLPTVETMRLQKPLLSLLQLWQETETNQVIIGDGALSDGSWQACKELLQNQLKIEVQLHAGQEQWFYLRQQERQDSSPYVIRSVTSRNYAEKGTTIEANCAGWQRPLGSICLANRYYERYSGELEIARTALPADPRQNMIGQVAEESLYLLPYIQHGMGFMLVPEGEGKY
ncbi:MAG TPA: MupG family TIM beta-alpha barrel fold protein [Bacillota bacterium]|nr:MupG family TIM beta-alpha barrel fold protein [Bacillota bacterium]